MKKLSKRLVSIITAVVVSSGFLGTSISASAATQTSKSDLQKQLEQLGATSEAVGGKYGTNPNGSIGKEKTITIDGSPSDWSEDMIIAQGMANDSPVKFKGDWENCVIDSYAMYAAWDDNNVYVAWQNVNTADVTNGQGAAISDGKLGPLPMVLAIDTGKGNAMTGRLTGGEKLWAKLDITYSTRVDHILAFSADGTGTPGFFTGDANGETNYKANCGSFKTLGIEYKSSYTCLPKQLLGIKNIPGTPEGVKMLYDDSVKATDLMSGHDTKLDSFYEMKIPLSALGITKDELLKNGIGIMELSTRGESAMDCLPHDPCMLDNVFGSYAAEPSNTHEKDDNDNITVPLAKIGKGGQSPVVNSPKISSFTADKESPQKFNSTINFNTVATGGTGELSYQYEVNSTVVKDYSSSSSFAWTPSTAGDYTVKVTVKDANGKTTSSTKTYSITQTPDSDIKIESFTTILTSPQKVETPIRLIAAATGGTGELQYKFAVNGSVVKDYSNSSSYTWIPQASGTYILSLFVKDGNGKETSQNISYVIDKNTTSEVTMNSFSALQASPQKAGTQITLNTSSAGGTGTLQTKFAIFDGSKWSLLNNYTTGSSIVWVPTKAGIYQINATVKDATGKTSTKSLSYVITANITPLIMDNLNADIVSAQAGTAINLNTSSTGGKGTLQTKFAIYDGANWTLLKGYSSSKNATWTPTKAGTYQINATVKDEEGKFVTKSLVYVVKPASAITINKVSADKISPQYVGTTINLTTTASSATNVLQYRYWVYDSEGNWTALNSFNSSNTVKWVPKNQGIHMIWVDVKDDKGNISSKYISYLVL